MVDFTVAIATYNGAKRLPLVLEKLRSQINTDLISWEIIVIDNNSQDDTAEVVAQYQAEWQHSFPIKYFFEPEQGLAFARQRAIQVATGELVGFLDDDNLPAPDWVIAAYKFGQQHPAAGAYGSKINGLFEVEPPEKLKKILFYLAIVDRGNQPAQYQPRQNGVPPGAGLVVRKQVWLEQVPPRLFLVGRVGSSMLPGEDLEALSYIHRGGWEIWYNPAMAIEHVIPAQRLEEGYFLSLMQGIGLCRHHLRMLLIKKWQKPFAFLLYFVSDLRKVMLHFIQYQSVLKTDIVAACEMKRLLGTLISPYYLWKIRLSRSLKFFN